MSFFKDVLNLKEGENDREKTLESIKTNISFKGANLWTLACAIIIASVGLNVNSTAVIIGAMLISPLMGPIVGAGFALGVFDFTLLKKSLRNLLNATLVSLIVSTLYFLISPFKDVQSELLSRTSPNIYDIFIAFFGGLVGVIAVTRTEKGNPIPGVAIATALMPPLCTAGYGLATLQWSYFFGAAYLYCINCVFIGIATFIIVKYLKYPPKKQVDEKQQRQVKIMIWVLTTVMLLPSSYLAYSLYMEQQFRKNSNIFIENEFADKGYTVVFKKINFKTEPKTIELAMLNKRFEKNEIADLDKKINENRYLKGADLIIRQDTTDRLSALKGDILRQVKGDENELNQKDVKIIQLEKELEKNHFDNKKLLKEARAIFPAINSLSVSNHEMATGKDSLFTITAVIYQSNKKLPDADSKRFKNWLNERLSVKNVQVFNEKD
ncbi:TIGR00341 family protein [Flavobacterium sp. NRK1]|uniref:TIGR00341 family protein n=1 Tax=Flavobacterium sp. NRK1 TaxID=2954929 RepID=UPI0020921616|nr:TIGR00341 family protein [Flavobacterium sp. NRK1]MCO6148400.1 TIGR00341 family protein [Flavobacterium sp. NRK1]